MVFGIRGHSKMKACARFLSTESVRTHMIPSIHRNPVLKIKIMTINLCVSVRTLTINRVCEFKKNVEKASCFVFRCKFYLKKSKNGTCKHRSFIKKISDSTLKIRFLCLFSLFTPSPTTFFVN
jgi:hypothetical protein